MKAKQNFISDRLTTKSIQNALDDRAVQILPKRDQHGRRILYMEMGGEDTATAKVTQSSLLTSGALCNCPSFANSQPSGTARRYRRWR